MRPTAHRTGPPVQQRHVCAANGADALVPAPANPAGAFARATQEPRVRRLSSRLSGTRARSSVQAAKMPCLRRKMPPVWYVLRTTPRPSQRDGPYTRSTIAAMFAAAELSDGALLWTNERIFPNPARPNSARLVRISEWRRVDQLPDPVYRSIVEMSKGEALQVAAEAGPDFPVASYAGEGPQAPPGYPGAPPPPPQPNQPYPPQAQPYPPQAQPYPPQAQTSPYPQQEYPPQPYPPQSYPQAPPQPGVYPGGGM